jgi:UDP-N-acetylglucosamine--N-acetylmuramyl-(pentapeptide) pyrophosphoryl-undecaprenol N-acetylglucosamine transferase
VKTIRVVSYAINGRGVGHLVRQLAILRWVKRYGALLNLNIEAWVLTTSEADTLARREGIPAFKLPSKAMVRDAGIEPTRYLGVARQWVMNAVAGLAPDILVVDTFPGGSFGELLPVLETVPTRVLVARAVKDDIARDPAYAALVPLYQRTIVPDDRGTGAILLREREELLDRRAARVALGIGDRRAVYVTLGGGGDEMAPRVLPELTDRLVARGWHVVVGAGPLYLGPERRGPHITWMDRYVPLELLNGVDAAVSAGGYNSVTELMFAGVPTVFLPQARIADDQEGRAKAAADAGAGRLARNLDEVPDLLEAPGDPAVARSLVPVNGARAAAIAVLGTMVPAGDLMFAQSLVTPELWARMHGAGVELITAIAGDGPSRDRERDALLASLVDEGVLISAPVRKKLPAAERVERYLAAIEAAAVPAESALAITRALRQRFPAATLDQLADGCAILFPAFARFADWMGAVALINAVPAQRTIALAEVAQQLATWLATEHDLFDAVRRFAHLEGHGKRSLAEVLSSLRADPPTLERNA